MSSEQETSKYLAKLPVELAHQIIDDLIVYDVVKLLWYDDTHVSALLSSHPKYKIALGEDRETFSQTKQAIKCYLNLYARAGVQFQRPWHGLLSYNLGSMAIETLREKKPDHILQILKLGIWDFLDRQIHTINLERYVDRSVFQGGIPSLYNCKSAQDLEACFDVVHHAKRRMCQQAFDQLSLAASLLEQNPDILKRTLDPEQKRRPNTAHIVARILYMANRCRNYHINSFLASEYFRYQFFPVIPFDSALAEMVQRMEKHGFIAEDSRMDSDANPNQKHSHPPSIREHADIVIKGMPRFFTSRISDQQQWAKRLVTNDKGDVLRTVNTPWSDQNGLEANKTAEGAFFTVHKIAPPADFKLRARFQAQESIDEKEEVWLVSFVGLYRYLEILEKTSTPASLSNHSA